MCKPESECSYCTDFTCVRRCDMYQRQFPNCRCKEWPSNRYHYDGPFRPYPSSASSSSMIHSKDEVGGKGTTDKPSTSSSPGHNTNTIEQHDDQGGSTKPSSSSSLEHVSSMSCALCGSVCDEDKRGDDMLLDFASFAASAGGNFSTIQLSNANITRTSIANRTCFCENTERNKGSRLEPPEL
ncbi:unnamed protein product [Amoebophrya sp. A25]|nr:unnamed protein product [Amoebophrya sp. A25]|eukprot:GSA25T00015473001.1